MEGKCRDKRRTYRRKGSVRAREGYIEGQIDERKVYGARGGHKEGREVYGQEKDIKKEGKCRDKRRTYRRTDR